MQAKSKSFPSIILQNHALFVIDPDNTSFIGNTKHEKVKSNEK